jgi:hypothetical protein
VLDERPDPAQTRLIDDSAADRAWGCPGTWHRIDDQNYLPVASFDAGRVARVARVVRVGEDEQDVRVAVAGPAPARRVSAAEFGGRGPVGSCGQFCGVGADGVGWVVLCLPASVASSTLRD